MNKRIAIIGGGLAGLTAAIHLSQNGFHVMLFEKDSYPKHKVCGEYLSNEIIPYLSNLKINLEDEKPASINTLIFSDKKGRVLKSDLEMGGLGMSRYRLDYLLYQKAMENGCEIINTNIRDISFENNQFSILSDLKKFEKFDFTIGAFGKRSILDKKLNRDFFNENSGWLGVKAHYAHPEFPDHQVQLHNFDGGYCGLSKTESGAVNVCYLASFKSFKKFKNTEEFRKKVLYRNPRLKDFFKNSEMIFDKELTIAQINFSKKSVAHNHVFMIGDAAGLIHPLCGNGMAMAIHSAKIVSEEIINNTHLENRNIIEKNFQNKWEATFSSRLSYGRILQKLLLNERLTSLSLNTLLLYPGLLPKIIEKTHGSYVK